jgi:hypothetical protein
LSLRQLQLVVVVRAIKVAFFRRRAHRLSQDERRNLSCGAEQLTRSALISERL